MLTKITYPQTIKVTFPCLFRIMSLSDRIANIINQKVNKIVERHDDPPEKPGIIRP